MRSANMERARKLNEMASALLAEEARLMPVALEKKDFEELLKPLIAGVLFECQHV